MNTRESQPRNDVLLELKKVRAVRIREIYKLEEERTRLLKQYALVQGNPPGDQLRQRVIDQIVKVEQEMLAFHGEGFYMAELDRNPVPAEHAINLAQINTAIQNRFIADHSGLSADERKVLESQRLVIVYSDRSNIYGIISEKPPGTVVMHDDHYDNTLLIRDGLPVGAAQSGYYHTINGIGYLTLDSIDGLDATSLYDKTVPISIPVYEMSDGKRTKPIETITFAKGVDDQAYHMIMPKEIGKFTG